MNTSLKKECERNINDVFEDILFSEERIIEESYKQGYTEGSREDTIEGYHLGYHRGAEIGSKLGYYKAFCEYNLREPEDKNITEKTVKHLEQLLQYIDAFPYNNREDIDLFQLFEQIEALYKKVSNVHMVDYFTKNVYCDFISDDLRTEALQYGLKKAVEAIYNDNTESLPILHSYINKTKQLTLKNTNVCMNFLDFQNSLQKLGCYNISQFKLDVFMKPKKSHEVEMLSWIASAIREISKTTHVIDIGDGKGYLSSMLALHYKIPVLGVDASYINTNGAVDRAKKLSKVWNGVVTHNKTRDTTINLYKQITKYVDEKVDFQQLISNIFLEEANGIGLVGLHTCGNLASSCLRIFNNNDSIKTICNVGCCYHHLTDEFEPQTNKNNYNLSQIGFPLSQYLKKSKVVLGRGARMVAAQSVERILHNKESVGKSIFFRSLFEVIIENIESSRSSEERHVGRFRKECCTFVDYVEQAAKRIKLNVTMSEEEINELYNSYEPRIDEINFFYLVRCMVAPVVESLILLDRLLYLFENGHQQSFLVQFFDPVISPRCYGIVSIK
ncbi:hypothetical protein GWI33_022781 [Rhynchophorus ferrugineus]|uniref:Methyltransferase domain-containing protein n=1 Tax=Rhynchophorus ferrugineus TaxID=354439 RepID=A0A834IU64_RHYFE|nr:hypothetical protein GWI33_022781 [Rhynchophorus ferrugineus]